jgi:hypothetical protein
MPPNDPIMKTFSNLESKVTLKKKAMMPITGKNAHQKRPENAPCNQQGFLCK